MNELNSLNDAVKILSAVKKQLCYDATAIYSKVSHAENYLNEQITDLLSAE